jgi:VWFA-related protein
MLTAAFVLLVSLGAARLNRGQQQSPPDLKGEGKPSALASPSPLLPPSGEQLASGGDVLTVDANFVMVPATVMDPNGRYVTDLSKENFRIFEDGVLQKIALFEPTEIPFTVLFLLDTSGSMADHLEELARAFDAFVDQLRPSDRLIAATFNERVHVLCEATSVKEVREGKKFSLRTGGKGTHLYEAVDDALKRTSKVRDRKAIILFSDGRGSRIDLPLVTAKDNLRDAEEQDALIYTVQFGSFPIESPRNISPKYYAQQIEQINGYMRGLAQKTGGRYYHIEDLSDLEKTFCRIADELGRQYSLGYYAKARFETGDRREIKVKVDRPSLIVRARESYIVDRDRPRGK